MMAQRGNRYLRLGSLLVLLAATALAWTETSARSAAQGDVLFAPDFTLQTLEGETIQLSKLKGQVVLVNFWATWCAPCRYEIPDLSRIYLDYKHQGVAILGVSVDEIETRHLVKFRDNYKMTYPVLHGSPAELQRLTQLYGGIYSIPTTFVIDRQGVIATVFVGAQREQVFRDAIKPLL